MKYLIVVAIFVVSVISVNGQNTPEHLPKYYLHIGGGPSIHNGAFADFGGTTIFQNKWIASVSYQNFDMNASNLPADYQEGYTTVLIFPFSDEMPSITMTSVNLMTGRYFPLGRKTWITAQGGLALTRGDKLTFTRQPVESNSWYVSSNYDVHKESASGAGAIIQADFIWAFVPYVGIGAGVFANMNSVQSTVGLQFKLVGGWMNSKREK